MTTWTEVAPLVDTPELRDYFPSFKVGDRVRVRLSGECRIKGLRYTRTGERSLEGHDDTDNGKEGEVVDCYALPWPELPHTCCGEFYLHPHAVRVNRHVAHFAACELERVA